ncbi:MAG: hypothetical protein JW836_04045 [Deltaproteobacteria bacterium]|nr:hypothetical protein [Deltaproteobacteria bacterium]
MSRIGKAKTRFMPVMTLGVHRQGIGKGKWEAAPRGRQSVKRAEKKAYIATAGL